MSLQAHCYGFASKALRVDEEAQPASCIALEGIPAANSVASVTSASLR